MFLENYKSFLSNKLQSSVRINFAEKNDTLTINKEEAAMNEKISPKEISMLDSLKAIQATDIPVKVIKGNNNFFAEQICAYFNESIGKGKFPNCLKTPSIAPVFKKSACSSKNNYRPMSILPVFSKIFEKLLHNQLLLFFDSILSKFQCCF